MKQIKQARPYSLESDVLFRINMLEYCGTSQPFTVLTDYMPFCLYSNIKTPSVQIKWLFLQDIGTLHRVPFEERQMAIDYFSRGKLGPYFQ